MKKIILCFFIFTTCLFANNYDDMFNELEGITSIVIIDSGNKEVIEGAKVQINGLNNFSNDQGIVKYKPSEDELMDENTASLTIKKKNYLTYQGDLRIGSKEKIVYLEKNIDIPAKKISKYENTKNIKKFKDKKILSFKVRVMALDDGIIYLADKKLRGIKAGKESFFRIKEGHRILTLDTEKAIYRKDITVVAPEMLVVFTKADIVKLKEKPIKAPERVKKVVIKVPKKEKEIKTLEVPKNITNEYLIAEIINPLEDGRAFNITTSSTYLEMEEDEDKGEFVIYKTANGSTGKMAKDLIRSARNKIGKNELLDDYYYIIANLEVKFDKDYLKKVDNILDKIAVEKKEYISIKSNWNTEKDGKYIAFSSTKRINNDDILNKLYRISYKKTKQYSDFFEKLNNAIRKKREYQIRLFDKTSPTIVFNMTIDGYYYYYSDPVNTDFGNKEIYSKYSSMGRYLDNLNSSLLDSLYNKRNEYYFLNNSVAKMTVHLLKENDGRAIIKSDYKKVR